MSPEEATKTIKELTTILHKHIGEAEHRHRAIDLLSALGAYIYLLRLDLQDARDLASEVLETKDE